MKNKRFVIVTGAGASSKLGSKGDLPLMAQWASILRGDLNRLEERLADAIGLREEMTTVEFEEVLGAFSSWESSLPLVQRFMGVGGNRPGSVESSVRGWLAKTSERASRLREALHTSLYREFGRESIDASKAAKAYGRVIDLLGGQSESFVFATTNYDPAIEVALAGKRLTPEDGFRRSPWQSPELRVDGIVDWDSGNKGNVPVLHLHGAVGWYRGDDGRITYQPPDQPFNPTLGAPVVLAPDPNKDPLADTYVAALWAELAKALRGATHVLVLGHSLHDRPLLDALSESGGHARLGIAIHAKAGSEQQAIDSVADAFGGELALEQATFIATDFGPSPTLDSESLAAWLE